MFVQVLIDWINSELEEDRIIVKDLEEDCYDGQVLQKLFGEKLVNWHHNPHNMFRKYCAFSCTPETSQYQNDQY